MNRRKSIPLVAAAVILLAGCGYFKAGTWEDDPKNWNRAFHSTKPPDVVVVHSKYWRSPHFTYEFQYFFEIVPTPNLMEQLFSQNDLRHITGLEAESAKISFFTDPPPWFVQKTPSNMRYGSIRTSQLAISKCLSTRTMDTCS